MREREVSLKGMHQVCRDIFGTEDIDELREIARKAKAYDELCGIRNPLNARGAGRKRLFTCEEVDWMITMYRQGKPIRFLAEYFNTSRQTIYKYLEYERRFERDRSLTMRMIFMYGEQECTVMDIDFKHKKVYIRNKTNDILHRAFGVIEEPTWEDFEEFLESRCFPKSRANLKAVLRDVGVSCYDPLQIVEKTQGRMAEDHQWIRILYREEVLANGVYQSGTDDEDRKYRPFV